MAVISVDTAHCSCIPFLVFKIDVNAAKATVRFTKLLAMTVPGVTHVMSLRRRPMTAGVLFATRQNLSELDDGDGSTYRRHRFRRVAHLRRNDGGGLDPAHRRQSL